MSYLTCLKCEVGIYIIKGYDYDSQSNTLTLFLTCNECSDEVDFVIELGILDWE